MHASTSVHMLKIPNTGSQTIVWHMEILHTLTGMGSAALVAAVCLTQPLFDTWKCYTHWQEWVALLLSRLCLTQVRPPELPAMDEEVLKRLNLSAATYVGFRTSRSASRAERTAQVEQAVSRRRRTTRRFTPCSYENFTTKANRPPVLTLSNTYYTRRLHSMMAVAEGETEGYPRKGYAKHKSVNR